MKKLGSREVNRCLVAEKKSGKTMWRLVTEDQEARGGNAGKEER